MNARTHTDARACVLQVDGEREVVLELIDMVEKIDENNLHDARRSQQLRTAMAKSSAALRCGGAWWSCSCVRVCLRVSVSLCLCATLRVYLDKQSPRQE